MQRVREEGLIDVEGLAGVRHSPEPWGGVRGGGGAPRAPAWAPPPEAGARARRGQGTRLFSPLLLAVFFLLSFLWA